MDACYSLPPKCLPNAPKGSDTLVCKFGEKIVTMIFHYQSCEKDQIAQWRNESGFICTCIENPIEDCHPIMYANQKCDSAFLGIISVQFLVIAVALFLNATVVYAFWKKPQIRKKIPNVLLFMHAVVDLMICLLYALPNPIFLLIQKRNKTVMSFMLPMERGTLHLSASSSILLFTLTAAERFVSLYKPIWHRLYISTRRVWMAAAVALTLSVINSCTAVITYVYHRYDVFMRFSQAFLCGNFLLVSILHGWTFKIAYFSKCKQTSPSKENTQWKKEFRLVLLFISMYCIFVIGFAPLFVTSILGEYFYNVCTQMYLSIFTLTSMLNPLLTFWLKTDFRFDVFRKSITNEFTTEQLEIP